MVTELALLISYVPLYTLRPQSPVRSVALAADVPKIHLHTCTHANLVHTRERTMQQRRMATLALLPPKNNNNTNDQQQSAASSSSSSPLVLQFAHGLESGPHPPRSQISSPARAMNNGWYKHCYCVAIRLVIVPDSHALRNTFTTLGQEWIAQALALRNSDDDDVDKSPRGNYHQAAR